MAVALAARAALRVLPIVWTAPRAHRDDKFSAAIVQPVFSATSIAWSAAKYPNRATTLGRPSAGPGRAIIVRLHMADRATFARAAARAAERAAAFSADANAVNTAFQTADAAAAGRSAFNPSGTAAGTSAAFWSALSTDATLIDEGAMPPDIAGSSLWHGDPPSEISELWREMKRILLGLHIALAGRQLPLMAGSIGPVENWGVWTDWYEARLRGDPAIEELEIARATIPDEIWDRGPAIVNAEIKRLIDRYQPPGTDSTPSTKKIVNSFSYARANAEVDPSIVEEDGPARPKPVEGVASAISYGWTSKGTIEVVASPSNFPTLPFPSSEKDHKNRLEACRFKAVDIAQALRSGEWNARPDYAQSLDRYATRLPTEPHEGNFLLAENEYWIIRRLAESDRDFLPPGLAAQLNAFMNAHMALRAYHPEAAEFIQSARSGSLEPPLPLDAFMGVSHVLQKHTPTKFEPEVGASLEAAAQPVPSIPPTTAEGPKSGLGPLAPPPDPVGEVDPEKARRFTMASGVNELVKVLESGEKVKKGVEGWRDVLNELAPYVAPIIQFLRNLLGS